MATKTPKADRLDGHVLRPNNPRDDAKGLPRFDNIDGFKNELTGIGDPDRDKTFGGSAGIAYVVRLLSGVECEDRWRGSDLGARIVETVPNEMIREGWDITIQPEDAAAEAFKPNETPTFREPAKLKVVKSDDESAPPVKANEQAHHSLSQIQKMSELEGEGAAQAEALQNKLRDLGAASAFLQASQYERAYGGGAVLIGADDGEQDLTKPLDESKIKSIKHLTAFRGGWDGELIAWSFYNDPTKPRYGEPEMYQLRNLGVPLARLPAPGQTVEGFQVMPPSSTYGNQGGPLTFWVHESRLLVLPGKAVSRRTRTQMRGWGDSIFTRVDEVLSQYSQTWGSVANLMTDWAQGVLKMDGLASLLATQDGSSDGVVAKRMVAIQMSKSIARVMLLDKDEEFTREVTPLSGIAEVLQQFCLRLAAAADMPVSLLMGQAPAGLSATGDADIRFFYDRIAARQRETLVPVIHRLVRLLMISKDSPTKGQEPAKWSVEMKPLWQMTAKEEADLRFVQAQADQIYLTNGVAASEEIAASRFGGSKWSGETVLDFENRVAMAVPLEPVEGELPPGEAPKTALVITPSAQGAIVTVNEARAQLGLPNLPDPSEGNLTIAEFTAKHATIVSKASNAEAGAPEGGKPQGPPFRQPKAKGDAAAPHEDTKRHLPGIRQGGRFAGSGKHPDTKQPIDPDGIDICHPGLTGLSDAASMMTYHDKMARWHRTHSEPVVGDMHDSIKGHYAKLIPAEPATTEAEPEHADFDPDQPRAENGQFGEGGGGGEKSEGKSEPEGKPMTSYPKTMALSPVTESTPKLPDYPLQGGNKEQAEYHTKMAEHFQARGGKEAARGHKAIAEKYEKKAAREAQKKSGSSKKTKRS